MLVLRANRVSFQREKCRASLSNDIPCSTKPFTLNPELLTLNVPSLPTQVIQKQQGIEIGPVWFFYGARKAATEFLYREEFEKYEKMGVLHMRTAFSRDQARKIYVQHRITEAADDVFRMMEHEKGSFYVCGSSR